MRIGIQGIVGQTDRSGAGRFLENVLHCMHEDNSQHAFVAFQPSDAVEDDQEYHKKIEHRRTFLSSSQGKWRHVLGAISWPKILADANIDVFHLLYPPLPLIKRCKTVLTVHDMRFLHAPETYPWARLAWLKHIMKDSILRADRILTVSQETKKDILQYVSCTEEKIDVVYHAVAPMFQKTTKKDTGLPASYLLVVGHLEKRKNIINLIHAFSKLSNQLKHSLVIVGNDHGELIKLKKAVTQYRLEKRVLFINSVKPARLVEIYSGADLLVMPSLHEGFGLPLIEAMACGTMAAASDIPIFQEVIGSGGIYFNPLDPDDIAGRIFETLHCRDQWGQVISKTVEKYSLRQFSRSLMRCYENAFNS